MSSDFQPARHPELTFVRADEEARRVCLFFRAEDGSRHNIALTPLRALAIAEGLIKDAARLLGREHHGSRGGG